jgi:putative transposase
MKKTRFTKAQIVKVLKQHEAGSKVIDLCREQGVYDKLL